jgi:hypothetical protein
MLSHQVKVDDPFTGLFNFHPVAITVSDDDEDDHSISSSVVNSQIYVESIVDDVKSFHYEAIWTPIFVEAIGSSMFVDVDHDPISHLIRNDDSSVLDHVPSTSSNIRKRVEGAGEGAPAPSRRRRKLAERRDQMRPLQPSFKPCAWDVVSVEEEQE